MSSSAYAYERFEGPEITQAILVDAAVLFSANYGIWGPLAQSKMGPSFATRGRRVKMNASRLKNECLPDGSRHIYVRVMLDNILVGNVFATRWDYGGRSMCWITQLVVSLKHRANGLATQLLSELREGDKDLGFGILSSHPFAILATLRAFGRGEKEVDLSWTKLHAASIMSTSPIEYVRTAKLRGSLFEDSTNTSGVISCADTNFWVDHVEPLEALRIIQEKGIVWPFGTLPEGHEFLVLVKSRDSWGL